MKKIVGGIAAAAMMVVAGTAFAEEAEEPKGDGGRMYGKLTLGYAFGGASGLDEPKPAVNWSGFEIQPTFGYELFPMGEKWESVSLALEGSLGLTFGGSGADGATVVNPGATAVLGWRPFELSPNLVAYGGAGLSLPIQFVSVEVPEYKYDARARKNAPTGKFVTQDGTTVGVRLNFTLGGRFDIDEKWSVLAESSLGFIEPFSFAARLGGMMRF